uniref:Uncharacterized protein n=1 Tax=Latimeria chalumnae TaxID=7897 RepID=H2ZT74_LATCH
PIERDYTFLSPVHHSRSRLDYFLISQSLAPKVGSCEIGVIALMHHAPIDLTIAWEGVEEKSFRGRMNTGLLQDPDFVKEVKQEIAEYIQRHKDTDTREAFKAFIRGLFMKKGATTKKFDKQKLDTLEKELKALQREYSAYPNPTVWQRIIQHQLKINEILARKVEFALFRLKLNFYESGNKSSEFLARCLKQLEAQSAIPGIMDGDGTVHRKNKFFDNTMNYYILQKQGNYTLFSTFFQKLKLSILDPETASSLETPISEPELDMAIKQLKMGKTP